MLAQKVVRISLDSFRERSAEKKVVLLYPWTSYRTLFLSYFLSNAREGLLYYRIPTQGTSITQWLHDMAQEFSELLGAFGSNLQAALERRNPNELGQALAADLAAYSSEPLILFIDEFDRIPLSPELTQFVNALVEALPKHVQISLSSRMLTYQPWYDIVSHGDAVVLGTEHRKNDLMFTVESSPKPQLEVYAQGRGYALLNGREIVNWDGALPRNLFFYLVDHPLITRDEIFAAFWPHLSVKEATNIFHVTKRKITEIMSRAIDNQGEYELTQYRSGFYIPSEKLVRHYDVEDFQDTIARASLAEDEREMESLLVRAIDLYRAPFLQTVEMEWATKRRDALTQAYADALISMGRIERTRGNLEGSLGYYTRALKERPEREDIHREVISLYLDMGRTADANEQFTYLEQVLQERLGITVSPETRALKQSIDDQA